jgi:AraC-like DNA-binding protein
MAARAADFAPVRFSTWDLPERERIPRWREEFGRGLVSVEIEPVSPGEPFHAEATLQALPGARMAFCRGSAVLFTRTRAQAAAGDDSIGLVVNFGPKAAVSQRGTDAALDTGDAFPILTDFPARLTSTNHLGIVLQRAQLAARVTDIDRAASRVTPHDVEALRLLVNYLRLIQSELLPASPEIARTVANHIHDLAALALGANRDTQHNGLSAVAAARLQAALAHIAARFIEPDLSLATLARRQGVSPRYLQRLFEASGLSFTARVAELRLQRAFALLTGPLAQGRRISEIALQSGFSDVSHFNRCFRVRFGDTPTGVRATVSRP